MEHHRVEKPLSFGEILDVTFRIIKENFSRLFLLLFIFLGPLELLQSISQSLAGTPFLRAPSSGQGMASFLESLQQTGTSGGMFDIIYFFLGAFIAVPITYASLIIATDQIRNKEPLKISSILKRAFSRYWALLGGCIVYGLIMFALIFGFFLSLTIFGGTGMFFGLGGGFPAGFGSRLVVIILLSICAFCIFLFLMIRWSFFFAAIVFEKVSPGLRKSWRLTRGNVWRLVGLYIVLIQLAVHFFLGNSVLATLLISLMTLAISLVTYIAYAVIYFDLRVRNEAMDLQGMIETYPNTTKSSSSLELVETKPES